MTAQIGSLYVSLTTDVRPFASDMMRASATVSRAAADMRKGVGTATSDMRREIGLTEQAIARFNKTASQRGKGGSSPYSVISASRAFDNATDRVNLLRAAMIATTAVAGGFTAALSSNVLLRYADSAVKVANSLRTVSKDSLDLAVNQERILRLANDNRSSLEATTTLYTRLRRAAPWEDAQQVEVYTSTISKALQLGGASAQESASAMVQLSQGLASNRLQGEELRAILETPLGNYLAKGLGVTIGQLREMGTAGKLTAKIVLGGLANISDEVNRDFAKSVKTIDQALQVADNNLTAYIGSVDQAYGITKTLADGIAYLANNLETIGPALAAVGLGLSAVFAGRLGARGIAALGAASFGVSQIIKEQAAEAKDQAKNAFEEIKAERDRLLLERGNIGIASAVKPETFAPQSMLSVQRREMAAVEAADTAREKSLARIGELTKKLGELTAGTSAKTATAIEKQVRAETKLASLKERLKAAEEAQTRYDRLSGLRSVSPAISAAAGVSAAENAGQIDRFKAQISEQEAIVRAAQTRIASLGEDADKRSAERRLKIERDIADERMKLAETERAGSTARSNVVLGQTGVRQAGMREAAGQISALDEQIRRVDESLVEAQTRFAETERAASGLGRSMTWVKAQGSALLGLFGGPWGAGLTGIILLLGYLEARSMAAEQQTQSFIKTMQEMGLVAPKAADGIREVGQSINEMRASQARAAAANARGQSDVFKEQLSGMQEDVALIREAMAAGEFAVYSGFGVKPEDATAVENLAAAFAKLQQTGSVANFRKDLEAIAASDISDGMASIVQAADDVAEKFGGATEAARQFERQAAAMSSPLSSVGNIFAKIGAFADQFKAQVGYITSFREQIARTAEQSKVLQIVEDIMSDDRAKAAGITEEMATALANMAIETEKNAEATKKANQELENYIETINKMVEMRGSYDQAIAGAPDFGAGSAAEEAKRRADEIDRAMQRMLRDPNAFTPSYEAATATNPFGTQMGDAYLQNLRQTKDQIALTTRAVEIYNEALSRGAYITMAQARATAAWEAARDKQEARKKSISDIVDDVKAETEELRRQSEALGMTDEKAAAYLKTHELINAATRAGVVLTSDEIKQIQAAGNAWAQAEIALKKAKSAQEAQIDAMDELRDVSKDALKGFLDDLREGKSLGEALLGVFDRLLSKFAEDSLTNLLDAAMGKRGEKGSGFFQSLADALFGKAAPAAASGAATVAGRVGGIGSDAVAAAVQGAGGTVSQTAGSMFNYLRSQGLSAAQSAALVGNIQQESGFRTNALNKGEGAFGLIQWRLDRRKALEQFAANRGADVTDPKTQLDFALSEMRGAEASAGAKFFAARDLPSANSALKGYIRYGDNSIGARLGYGQQALDQYGALSPIAQPATQAASSLKALAEQSKTAGLGIGDLAKSLTSVPSVTASGAKGTAGALDLGALAKGDGGITGLLTQLMSGIGQALKGILSGLGGILKGIFSSIFSGFHASGGTIGKGQFGVVGERGPELIAAGARALTVIPTSPMQAAGATASSRPAGPPRGGIRFAPVSNTNVTMQSGSPQDVAAMRAMLAERDRENRRTLIRDFSAIQNDHFASVG